MATAITKIKVPQLKHIASGKVREIFEVDSSTLLFVATDRISAYDVILDNGIPSKGALLTQLSAHWFALITQHFPTLRTHLISTSLPPTLSLPTPLSTRSMLVRRTPVLPLESIVRGYITGSAWSEYQNSGTVHGMPMPQGLREAQKLEKPIWTPSTKAEQGDHDENISRARAVEIVGEDVASRMEALSLGVYSMAHEHALKSGVIIADTKFEFGLDPETNELVLIDEVLTPDSSRLWPAADYEVGKGQKSYDKQYLRDWLTREGLKGKQGVAMPEEVVRETGAKYREAYEKITGKKWVDEA
ncbi:phosphoribosylaminoimidazole-succinocarboxamide synthase like protein [Zymoseptoria brevis]|uniref:Phosphoribosylaminoimidazole-succinocarboxamide synthase n=1 Tax=Zymoseptoria brevis TaxID=1047168 RepID=A0A0F4G9B9_9PEZI|nr:phosphoribosylaminoimidazole-succinocarboxamide synthase like protein [Zymoseptoria brevis]